MKLKTLFVSVALVWGTASLCYADTASSVKQFEETESDPEDDSKGEHKSGGSMNPMSARMASPITTTLKQNVIECEFAIDAGNVVIEVYDQSGAKIYKKRVDTSKTKSVNIDKFRLFTSVYNVVYKTQDGQTITKATVK